MAVNPKLYSTTLVGVVLDCCVFTGYSISSLFVHYMTFHLPFPGLSIPVPRGRKGKRVKAQSTFDVQKVEWIRKYNPDTLLLDDSYRKHLKHQCNKSENHSHLVFVL